MKRLLLIVALVAVTMRGLIPTGWMPSGERAFAITVCTGTVSETVWLDQVGKLHKQDPSGKKHDAKGEPCAFAGTPLASGVKTVPELAGSAPERLSLFRPTRRAAIGQGLAAPPPPATGPPHLT